MSNAVGRLRTMGIAAQPTFGTAVTTSQFVLPLTNMPEIESTILKVENNAALGSAYQLNELENGNRFASVPLEFKIDEDQLPLILKQRYTITSVTASGESAVYDHTGAYSNTTNTWYTLILEDGDRTDYVVRDVLFTDMTFTYDGDFFRVSTTANGAYPEAVTVSNTVTAPKEFVGRMASFKFATTGSTTVTASALSAELTMSFGTNGDDTKFNLGSQDLGTHVLTADEAYTLAVTRNEEDRATFYDVFTDNTPKEVDMEVTSLDRFVSGSVANTNPSVGFNFPYAKISEYTEGDNLDELVSETGTFTVLDKPGVSGAPMNFTITNATASY
jgi:hypothetical protein